MTTADHVLNVFGENGFYVPEIGYHLPQFCEKMGPSDVIRRGMETTYHFGDGSCVVIIGDVWYTES